MKGNLHDLPPSKRFKLFHQNQHQDAFLIESPISPKFLPAKKRLDSHHPLTSICLPAKKRIWGPNPLFPLHEHDKSCNLQPYTEIEEEEDDGVVCSVCQGTDGEPADPIVFCDGCELMVHASCYGSPLIHSIPEGDWFCLRCQRKGEEEKWDFDCLLCPKKGGAVKPMEDKRQWAHILCGLLVPEVFFRDPVGREGIDCSGVPEKRWGIDCYICGVNRGCGIECSESKCGLGFHVSCGLEKGLSIEYKEGKGVGIVAGFCEEHTQLWKKQELTGKYKIVPREKLCSKAKISG
ncbi:protein Jade-1 [Phalaenopsis equestris]|uniref:protein Jade-1 n=1 Tax=Phalaenopsis equestris TaxID=78828 RepID=UPI0009E420D4|nr:protein Jade-1 [Phalaenopsis equestris]